MKTLLATVALAALIASPALAQTTRTRGHVQQSQQDYDQGPSYQGHANYDVRANTERTCGFEEYQYDGDGVPRGPYCH
jgi:hypothetical protein